MTVVTIELATEEDVLDGRYLDVIIERWLDDRARRLPPASVTAYRVKIRHFQGWWGTVGPSQGWQLREVDLQLFERHLSMFVQPHNGNPLAYSTRREALGRLRSAFHWAYRKGYTRHLNCAYWVPPATEGSGRLRLPISVTHLAALIRTAGEMEFRVDEQHFLRMRNQALLATLIGTGARRSEVAALTVGDVTLRADNSGDLHIRSAKKVRGRTVHQRVACFDRYTGCYLAPWLSLRRRDADAPLWPSVVNGDSLTGQGVYKVLRTIAAAAGVACGGVHDLRRTFITYFADKRPGEGYYHLLQLQIGHKPQGITHQLYDLRTIGSIRAVFCSPMEEVVRLIRV